MRKHMETVHGVFEKRTRKAPTFGQAVPEAGYSHLYGNTVQFQNPDTPFDRSIEWLSNLTKLAPFANLTASLQATEDYKNKISMLEHEIARMRSENWIIPNSDIHGLSGYVCRRCNSVGFGPIRDIGYDMTMQSRHTCDEDRVKSIKMASIRPSVLWSLYDTVAGMMLDKLNRLMPRTKYMLAEDVSILFNSLERLKDPVLAKLLIGIPNRYYFYSVKSGVKVQWLERVTANLGMKTIAAESEIRDFLRRVQSTYAFFETTRNKVLKRYLITITT